MRGAVCAWIAGLLGLAATACVPLPIQTAPGVEGIVVDAETREPLRGAVVVVRFDGSYDDVLPDRDLLGHREAYTDRTGRFRIPRLVRPGISAWPLFETEARVVGVMLDGYRCGGPQWIGVDGWARLELEPALDDLDRRDSCRPVAAERGEAPTYMSAWRGLHPSVAPKAPERTDPDLERVLQARATFGYGDNCEGPVADLSLSPDGAWAAWAALAPGGSALRAVEFRDGERGKVRKIGLAERVPPRRLAWSGPEELVLWDPASDEDRRTSASIFGSRPVESFWRPYSMPASPAPAGFGEPGRLNAPLDPADLNDEGDARWHGRSFWLSRTLDGETGLPMDFLEMTGADGSRASIELPGEACGPHGHFGRPHYRIAADGRSGLDLRFVNGGCHVVSIDLESGEWSQVDSQKDPGVCAAVRRVPATHLRTALRGYSLEVEAAITAGGADPSAAFVLRVEDAGTVVETRDHSGTPRVIEVPMFPVWTPLQRIHVSVLGSASPGPAQQPAPIPGPQPL